MFFGFSFFHFFKDRKQQKLGMGSITFPAGQRAEGGSMAWGEESDRRFNECGAQPGGKDQKEVVTIDNASSQTDGQRVTVTL